MIFVDTIRAPDERQIMDLAHDIRDFEQSRNPDNPVVVYDIAEQIRANVRRGLAYEVERNDRILQKWRIVDPSVPQDRRESQEESPYLPGLDSWKHGIVYNPDAEPPDRRNDDDPNSFLAA
ncbi:hypothetical protein A3G69_01175 [Candidatus Peribacteria bacterium RIFCSPLOWO2_12_FULL_53_10]|nr:MAG: hypothetical protein A3G69_01175 [Candidatus Peribacteria bacterium RIFCSPLOWO2_12_FULL_53_10]